MKQEFGLIGLGVMGKSLSRNLASKNIRLSLYNRFVAGSEEQVATRFVAQFQLHDALGFEDLTDFVQSLARPRKIFLMIDAGKAIDATIESLIPLLEADDIVMDGGNSHYLDTQRRGEWLAKNDILFIGTGVSGGEEGALKGPSIMPGGSEKAYQHVAPYLEAIAAKDANGLPCCHFIGKGGAGHFVKMVHNGIEYAEMQLLAEVYSLLREANGFSPEHISTLLNEWNEGALKSYLLEITAAILMYRENGELLLDNILDEAGNKGTGSWTTIAACELGVPIPTITASLFARYTSSMKKERVAAATMYAPFSSASPSLFEVETLKNAYQLARISNHQQGIHLISEASKRYDWQIDLASLARIWTNGCIIRSALMERFIPLLDLNKSLLLQPEIMAQVQADLPALNKIVALASQTSLPIPCLESAATYLKAYLQRDASANLIQAQRDYFGAHTYKLKNDAEGKKRHTNWVKS
jgi:6-phosphogluconate dehydrogenase